MTEPLASATILRVRDLGVTYPDGTVALRATNIDFKHGELTVLLGLSGAGKSSLLRCLNHLVVPTQGKIESLRNGDLTTAAQLRAHRRDTAMVFQHHQLLERQTALHNVLTGRLAFHGTWRSLLPLPHQDIDIARRALERVGLADKLFTRVDQMSGGQQQRVGIARALAQQPSVILADEPVASLDPATSEKILDLLQTICKEDGITAIMSLHQLDYARRFADRVIGLAQASVVYDGEPDTMSSLDLNRIYQSALQSAGAEYPKHNPEPLTLKPTTEMIP